MATIRFTLVAFVMFAGLNRNAMAQSIDLHEFNAVVLEYSNDAGAMMPPDWHARIGYDINYACSGTTSDRCSWQLTLKPMAVQAAKDPLPTIDGHEHDVIEDYDIDEDDSEVQFRSRIRIAPVGGAEEKVSAIQDDFDVPAWNYITFSPTSW